MHIYGAVGQRTSKTVLNTSFDAANRMSATPLNPQSANPSTYTLSYRLGTPHPQRQVSVRPTHLVLTPVNIQDAAHQWKVNMEPVKPIQRNPPRRFSA